MKKYEFQVNTCYSETQISACGMGPEGPRVTFDRSLSGLLTRLKKVHGIRLEQIILTFQPED